MSGVELDILVQKADEVSVESVLDFIKEHNNRRFVLIYSALKDEMMRLNFFTSFLKKNDYDFLACNFSGFITNTGYYSDAVAVCVFSGDFQAEIHHTPIDYENIQETANRINKEIKGHELCLIHSANLVRENYQIDKILRRIQEKNPELQILGGVSSPPTFVATREGIFNETIAFALIKGIDYIFSINTGFEVDASSTQEFTITKSDENGIYQLDGKNAAQEFQRIQHVRDYLFNRVTDLTEREDLINLPKYFERSNEIIFDVVNKAYKDLLGNISEHGFINMFGVAKIEENTIRASNSRPEGTILKRTKTTPEKQLGVYDRLYEKHSEGDAMILIDCAMRLFYYNYRTDKAYEKLKKINCPFIAPQVYGEIGNYTPYHPKENLLHNFTVKALTFK